MTQVSCPSASLCVAVDDSRYALDASPRPTGSEIKSLIYQQLRPSGRAAPITALLKHNGYAFAFTTPTVGHMKVSWYRVTGGTRFAARRARPVLIGRGGAYFGALGTATIKVKLTHQGKQLLDHAAHLTVAADARLRRSGRHAITVDRTFTLRH